MKFQLARHGTMLAALLLVPLSALSCSVDELKQLVAVPGENSCKSNSDCGSNRCDTQFGACVADRGELSALVLEVTPPASVRGYGGLKFFHYQDGLARSSRDLQVLVPAPTAVTGRLLASAPDQRRACSDAGDTTIAVQATFTPVENIVGLGGVSYHGSATLVGSEQVFQVSLPAGAYDVYLEPIATASDAGPAVGDCQVLPQLSRGVQVSGDRLDLTLNQAVPQPLEVVIPSQARFDGWTVDLIHPVTGQLLSSRAALQLHQTADSPVDYRASIDYSLVTGADYSPPGQELVRLTPPSDITAPVVLMHRAALEVFTPGKAVIEQLQPFGRPIDFAGWVMQKEDPSAPGSGSVTFSARSLSGLAPGIFVSFEVTSTVEPDGQVRASLLPGDYRVRTVPEPGSGLAAVQTEITVQGAIDSGAPSAVQAGQVIELPPAAHVSGRLNLPSGIHSVVGAETILDAAVLAQTCAVGPADAGSSDNCPMNFDPVLTLALAQDQFTPRRAESLVTDTGRFSVGDVDCGSCERGAGALFDLSVRPPPSSRLPWSIKPGLAVDGDVDLGVLPIGLPILHQGVLRVSAASCQDAVESCVLPGALVRAFVVLDDQGQVALSPSTLPSCPQAAVSNVPSVGDAGRCARTTLQVAETRANDSGEFELVLPAGLN